MHIEIKYFIIAAALSMVLLCFGGIVNAQTSTQPSITVISPNGGETFTTSQSIAVTWTMNYADTGNSIVVTLFNKGSGNLYNSATIKGVSGTNKFTIPAGSVGAGNYEVQVVDNPGYGGQDANDSSDNYFTITGNFTVSCSASPASAKLNQPVVWSASASGESGGWYSYHWSGNAFDSANPYWGYATSYTTAGTKTATITATDDSGNITTANCSLTVSSAQVAINGSCGVASLLAVGVAPTANLCSAGTASALSGSGPWSWTCAGSNGGTTDSCSASTYYAITGTCSVSPNPASAGQTVTWTATASGENGTPTYTWSGACTGSGATCAKSFSSAGTENTSVIVTDSNGNSSGAITCTKETIDALSAVTYNKNGGTGGSVPVDSNKYAIGSTVTVLDNTGNLTKTNYIFNGWNTKSSGSGTSYAANATLTMGSANVTLYANWTKTYTVTYNKNSATGGSVPVDSHKYVSGATVTVLDNTGSLVRTNYIFNGWNTKSSGSGTSYAANATLTMGSANVTLYANWTKTTSFNVSQNALASISAALAKIAAEVRAMLK